MRLANGIIIDKEKTFGVLKFSALRREVHIQNEDGTASEEIKERTYDLKSRGQGRMIQVSIPASVPLKEFDYNAEVEIINPVADTVATATFQGADVYFFLTVDRLLDGFVLAALGGSRMERLHIRQHSIIGRALKKSI